MSSPVTSCSAVIEKKILHFLQTNFLLDPAAPALGPQDSLVQHGVIDSTGVLELVGFLEHEFGLQIEDPDIVPDNLDTLSGLTLFVQRKTSHAG